MSDLFRHEAITGRKRRLMGDVILAQPLPCSLLTILLGGIVIAAAVFVSLGTYARKETVTGFLSPDKGLVIVDAPRPGVIAALHVGEGQDVPKDSPLFTLFGDRVTDDGVAVDSRMLTAIQSQLDEIENRKDLATRRRAAAQERLLAELAGFEAEQVAVTGQMHAQRQLIQSLQSNYERVRDVHRQGYASDDDLMKREENLLANRQLLAGLEQTRAANDARIDQAKLALGRLPLDFAEQLSQLASSRAELVLRMMDLKGRRSITITAPVAGKVSALRAINGTSVGAGMPLLTIIPEGGKLEAQLFVPTRAIGFVAVGQEVRLLYDAFDYRRFGVHGGKVTEVSSAVFFPQETHSGIRLTEPAYRVTVALGKQVVAAYGTQFPLQAGMQVQADIVLDKRSLVDWLIDPLISLRGRT